MRRHARLAALAVVLLAGCGGSSHHAASPDKLSAAVVAACPQAANGQGHMGACAPKAKLGLTAPHRAPGSLIYPDLSNNDPCVCGGLIRSRGQVGLIVKANQGVGFIDRWAVSQIQSARAAGLTVGVYDFDQDYTIAEAKVFVSRAYAAGIYPSSKNTFPLYLDVEFGNFNYSGLIAQINYLHSLGYRVGIYTGDWYWTPHAGCRWVPGQVTAWLSGYPNAIVPCGLSGGLRSLYNAHQFTSTPIDLTVWLGSAASYRAFVSASPPPPPPDPYRIYDKTRRHLKGGVVASEHNTVATWDRFGCRNPVRRSLCRSSRFHLLLLDERLRVILANDPNCIAGFGPCPTAKGLALYHRGARESGLARRLRQR